MIFIVSKNLNKIHIFFAVDDQYIPFLAVAIKSLIENISSENQYEIKILNIDVCDENINKILKLEKENINIEFVNLKNYIEKINAKLYTRDYYTKTTYFRLFIPEIYKDLKKAIYLDSDIVVLDDIAKLYNIDIEKNLIGGISDDIIASNKTFQDYVEKVVGVKCFKNYFNAGVLIMNLEELRNFQFQEKFLHLLNNMKFSFAQDQDYLNRICKGRVKYIDRLWDVMPVVDKIKKEDIKIVHYNLSYKPWYLDNVSYSEFFWKYAEKTEFIDKIQKIKNTNKIRKQNYKVDEDKSLIELAQKESECVGDDRENNKIVMSEKYMERMQVLERIKQLEKEGRFDIDAEIDPPTIMLKSNKIDYLKEKRYNKFKNKVANFVGSIYFKEKLKENKVIIKKINGIENLKKIESGAIITCNHFNPYDAFSIEQVFRMAGKDKTKKLYKVIREGNYTNFSGLYGFFFRNCDTLPLSSSKKTMIKFIKAVNIILQRGDFILVYPEQSLWWNYRKPKPLKNGAFNLAARNYVPIIPVFITMEDSNIIGEDGFPVQEYTINIENAIYPLNNLKVKENIKRMKNKNFKIWKKVYEEFYKIPLEYTTIIEKVEEHEKFQKDNIL